MKRMVSSISDGLFGQFAFVLKMATKTPRINGFVRRSTTWVWQL